MTYHPDISPLYEALWQRATTAFQRGIVEIDPYMHDLQNDQRRGIGCIVRPQLADIPAVSALLNELAVLVPDQHDTQLSELHVSVVTPLPAFVGFDASQVPVARYAACIAAVAAAHPPFTLTFQGITASPSAIMLQGFFAPGTLDTLRSALVDALSTAGLADNLDQRYPLRGAHMTLLRFRRAPANLALLPQQLAPYRDCCFGTTIINAVDVVVADWYMSHAKVHLAQRCAFAG